MKKYILTLALAVASIVFVSAIGKQDNVQEFSISLSVKDIAASKAFYEKLGFRQLEGQGGVDQKWLIMKNGAAKIGLFQGMFPQNTITMNPGDARSIYKLAIKNGLKATFSNGMDKAEGPASFALVDPDGNPILVDQH